MKKIIRLTENDLHNIVKKSVYKILKENDGRHIFYEPNGDGDDEKEEWEEAGLSIYDFSMVRDREVADFHFSKEGYIIYYNDEEFGEVWYENSLGCYRGVSDDDMFNGYKRGFEGMRLNDIFEDIMDKAADAILYCDDDEDDDSLNMDDAF